MKMNNIDVENTKRRFYNHFKHNFPKDLRIEIDIFEDFEKMIVYFFWNKKNQLEWNESKVFPFKISDYSRVLESEIKPFGLTEKH